MLAKKSLKRRRTWSDCEESKERSPCYLLTLPRDLLNCLIHFLGNVDVLHSLRSTCKYMYDVLKEGMVMTHELRLPTPEQARSFYALGLRHKWRGKHHIRGSLSDSEWHMFQRLVLLTETSSLVPSLLRDPGVKVNRQVCQETVELVVCGEAIDVSMLPFLVSLKRLEFRGGTVYQSHPDFSLGQKCPQLESLVLKGTLSKLHIVKDLVHLKHLCIKTEIVNDDRILNDIVTCLAPQLVTFELQVQWYKDWSSYRQLVKSLSWPRLTEYRGFEMAIPPLPGKNRYRRLVVGSTLTTYLDQNRLCQILQGHLFDVLVLPRLEGEWVHQHEKWLQVVKESGCQEMEFFPESVPAAFATLIYAGSNHDDDSNNDDNTSLIVKWKYPGLDIHLGSAKNQVQCFFDKNRFKVQGNICCCMMATLSRMISLSRCDFEAMGICKKAEEIDRMVLPNVKRLSVHVYTAVDWLQKKPKVCYPSVEELILGGGLFLGKEKMELDYLAVMFPNLKHVSARRALWATESGTLFRNKYHNEKQSRWIKCWSIDR